MKYFDVSSPKHGNIRICRRFAFFPLIIRIGKNKSFIWFKHYTVKEKYDYCTESWEVESLEINC